MSNAVLGIGQYGFVKQRALRMADQIDTACAHASFLQCVAHAFDLRNTLLAQRYAIGHCATLT
jgi:hypothetical protein